MRLPPPRLRRRRQNAARGSQTFRFAWSPTPDDGVSRVGVACLVGQGVLIDELRLFEHAISDQLVRAINVGGAVGSTPGVGGVAIVDETFADHDRSDSIVFVPGGIGMLGAADNDELLSWLQAMVTHADWVIASSTGSLLIAATGVLAGRPVATHWLAKSALRDLGAEASDERMLVQGNVITCSGQSSIAAAVEVALGSTALEMLPPGTGRARDAAWRRPND